MPTGIINSGSTASQTRQLSAKTVELLNDRHHNLPVWIRSPKSGTEFYTGFSRAKLYQLATDGKIRSVSIREPGQVKGTRLFNLQSIFDLIESCETNALERVMHP
jgi:hypothetical protein